MNKNVGLVSNVKKAAFSSLAHGAQRVATRAEGASERQWEIRRKLVRIAPWAFGVFFTLEMVNLPRSGVLQLLGALAFLGSFAGLLYLWNDRRGDAKYTRVWTVAEIGLVRVVIAMWLWPLPKILAFPVAAYCVYMWTKRPKKSDDDAPES